METVERFLALQQEHLGPEGYHLEIRDEMLGRAKDWPEDVLGPRTIAVGAQELPAMSRLVVWATGSPSPLGWLTLRLNTDRRIQIAQITSSRTGVDASEFFNRLLALKDLNWWKTRALLELVLSAGVPYVADDGRASDINDLPEESLLAVLGDMQEATTVPQRTRRDRITPDRLRDVANIYRQAWNDGLNPTQEVARHFERPYSTASRWVVAARKAGVLGPADSSRGGEIDADTAQVSDE